MTWGAPVRDELQERNNRGCCARGACQASLKKERWYNKGNGYYYCRSCAHLINRANPMHKKLCSIEHELETLGREWEEMKYELLFELPLLGGEVPAWHPHAQYRGAYEVFVPVRHQDEPLSHVWLVYSPFHKEAWVEHGDQCLEGKSFRRSVTSQEELINYGVWAMAGFPEEEEDEQPK